MRGLDLDGNEIVLEGDDLLGRMFQHEIDHLDGVLCSTGSTPTCAARRCASCATASSALHVGRAPARSDRRL